MPFPVEAEGEVAEAALEDDLDDADGEGGIELEVLRGVADVAASGGGFFPEEFDASRRWV